MMKNVELNNDQLALLNGASDFETLSVEEMSRLAGGLTCAYGQTLVREYTPVTCTYGGGCTGGGYTYACK